MLGTEPESSLRVTGRPSDLVTLPLSPDSNTTVFVSLVRLRSTEVFKTAFILAAEILPCSMISLVFVLF